MVVSANVVRFLLFLRHLPTDTMGAQWNAVEFATFCSVDMHEFFRNKRSALLLLIVTWHICQMLQLVTLIAYENPADT